MTRLRGYSSRCGYVDVSIGSPSTCSCPLSALRVKSLEGPDVAVGYTGD